ncbi:uncharacterized protein LOC134200041 [Bombyx mori]|uniref:uncharacterized protein LOC134200041 n=1 Tax=Bombyx mori TaxID=7091 RepID=UPI002ED1D484
MYRMVKVVPEHTDFQRVLWRENPSEEVKDCRVLRVTFGVSSAPYLAVKSLQERNTGLSWDQEVTSNLLDEWISFRDNLPALNQVTVPRWVNKIKYEHLNTSRKQWEQKLSEQADRLPTLSEFQSFLESRYRALDYLEPNQRRESRGKDAVDKPKVFSVTTSVSYPFCSGDHLLYQCKKFVLEAIENRREFIQKRKLCFNCFGANHSVTQCKRRTACRCCGRRHHSLLHQEGGTHNPALAGPSQPTNQQREPAQEPQAADHVERVVSHFSNSEMRSSSQVMLTTALVNVSNKGLAGIVAIADG